jgi:hypothetical protein
MRLFAWAACFHNSAHLARGAVARCLAKLLRRGRQPCTGDGNCHEGNLFEHANPSVKDQTRASMPSWQNRHWMELVVGPTGDKVATNARDQVKQHANDNGGLSHPRVARPLHGAAHHVGQSNEADHGEVGEQLSHGLIEVGNGYAPVKGLPFRCPGFALIWPLVRVMIFIIIEIE